MTKPIKILTVIGARPQFIKCAVVSRLITEDPALEEILVHTGQHFDAGMSDVFFEELGIPAPDMNLHISGGRHGEMTGKMLAALEDAMLFQKPDVVLVYGDTNSTLAGALAASKIHIPVAHVEAGLRSFNRLMPEETNRVLADHVSSKRYCPTPTAVENLANEGITEGVLNVGDVMYDAALYVRSQVRVPKALLDGVEKPICLCTLHRAETTDDKETLGEAFDFVSAHSKEYDVIFPMHPRTRKKAADFGLQLPKSRIIEPLGYLNLQGLLAKSSLVLTDSGGLQKEAYFHRVPCITLRSETEWVETIEAGWNRLWKGADFCEKKEITPYGDGTAGNKILDDIRTDLRARQ